VPSASGKHFSPSHRPTDQNVTILAKHQVQTQTFQLAMSAEPAAAHLLSVGWLTAADAA